MNDLHFVALAAITLYREGILAFVMTGTAGFSGFHVSHSCFQRPRLIREDAGVAIGTFVALQMEFVAESRFTSISLERDNSRFQSFMAFPAIARRCECVFAVVTDAAGLAFNHVIHGGFADYCPVGERFCMAIFAAVRLGMKFVAEGGCCHSLQIKSDFLRFQPFVATVTVGRYRKGPLSVMACTAGAPFLHFRHGYRFFLTGNDDAVMAPFAGPAGFGDMCRMAEY